jgi:ABC-type uncharacterized transport system involved in gliding motility auxiliary subunit
MNKKLQKFAPYGLYLSIAAALTALGLYILQREVTLALRISLSVIILGIALFVFLDPDKAKEYITGRQGRNTSNVLLMVIAVLGILVVINYLGNTYTKRWDITQDKNNTLTKETLEILKKLPSNVTVTGFFTPQMSKEAATQLLDNYKIESSGKLDYKFIDPNADPVAAREAKITSDGTLILTMEGRSEQVTYADEKGISNALVRLSNPGNRAVYFLAGHGEYPIEGDAQDKYSIVKTVLEGKNYTVKSLDLLNTASIPEDAMAIIIAGGTTPLNEKEVGLLKDYLAKGKAIVWLDNPPAESGIKASDDLLGAYLKSDWGITMDDDLMIDTNINPPTVVVTNSYGKHAITDRLQNLYTLFPVARSIQFDSALNKDITGYPLVNSSSASWGETDQESIKSQKVSPDVKTDRIGPVMLAFAAQNITTKARIVAVGDAEFANDTNYQQYGNSVLIINAIDWAAGQEDMINLTPRDNTQRTLIPATVFSNGLIFLITVLLIPGAILIAGIVTSVQRKKRG